MKKIYTLVNYCTFLCFAIILFSLNSCSNEDEEQNTEPETIFLNADKNHYAPYEIVTITAEESVFSYTIQTAKINGIDVELSSEGDRTAFVLPNLENGNYNIIFTLGDNIYDVTVKVIAQTTVLDADSYFSELNTNLNNKVLELGNQIEELQASEGNTSQIQSLQNDLTFYQNQINEFTSQYNNLSIEEKAEFAKAIAANKNVIDEYDALTIDFAQSTFELRSIQTVQDYESQVEVSAGLFVASVVYTVGHIPFILAGGNVAAATGGNPGVVLALTVVVASFMINVINTATMAQNLTIKSLKPYEFIMSSGQNIFQTGEETAEIVQAKYRSLINSDGGNAIITIIVDNYNLLKDKYNNFRNILPSIIRPSFIMTSLKNTYNSTTRSIYNQYVNITDVSNPNVTLQQLNQQDGSIKIKATTTATTDQTFTYKVNYTNSNFTSDLNKTVNAKVLVAVDSTDIYKQSMIGTWTVSRIGPGSAGDVFKLQIDNFVSSNTTYSSGSYFQNVNTGEIYDPPYPANWTIQKINNHYYYIENGFWNWPFTFLDFPLEYPVTNFQKASNGNLIPVLEYIKN